MAVAHRPATTRERLLERSRDELAPHKSLEAVTEASTRVVGAVSVAATLVAALGLVSATTLSDSGWEWALPTVTLAALSVTLAVWSTVPSQATVSPGDLEDVRRFFASQINQRGRLIRAASLAFGLSVLLTPLPAVSTTWSSSPGASFSISAVRREANVSVTVAGSHLPVNTVVMLYSHHGSARRLLLDANVGVERHLSSAVDVPLAAPEGSFELELIASVAGRVLVDKTTQVPEA